MSPLKLRILLSVLFLVIVSIVAIVSTYRTPPSLPSIELPPSDPIAIGTPLPPAESPTPTPESANFVGRVDLIIPVAGVRPEQLLDTFSDARSEGRSHDAIDIIAPAETPVLAAADGKILKLFQSERGGTTIYQLSSSQELVFYYAHLSHYAEGLTEGSLVRQGEVIAYVGDTGNAGPGNYHLHFSIAMVTDPKRYWEGTNINPYPLLQNRAR
ncbi:MAG TPA: M23 family metallopeptidase [Pyrinomonadaceae bacterium]|jgi:murein DD-endopeptidase MepM/ murein hydrolase activator NlpD|nr:M23 family metallopeptidase [Pyrinomonadaceae bacterium]